MALFRKTIFWLHLATGVAAGLVVFVMSVTGVLLTYEKQMLAWANARAYEVAPPTPGARKLGPEELLARALSAEPGKPTAVTWRAGEDRPVEVAFGREKTVFVDPYTGTVLGQGAAGTRAFFRKVTDWHRWLGAQAESRETGKMITGASNLGFLFLVLSGFYLWWPRNWTRRVLRSVTWFQGGLSPKARDFNWHNVIGFWSCVPLAVIVASAVVISYPWASNLVYRSVGEEPPAQQGPGGGGGGAGARPAGEGAARAAAGGGPGARSGGEGRGGEGGDPVAAIRGIDPAWAVASRRVEGWRSLTMQVPEAADAPVSFNIDRGSGGQPHKRATLALDRATGEVTKWEPFSAGTKGRKLRSILRFAHTGEVLGLPGQTLAGIVSLGAAVLVFTGLALSLRRFAAWRGRRRREPVREPAARRPRVADPV
ncbi:MAG TPA: PepSY-associated TM helix domain-containing protein [Longimicrobiaceae bacterium]